MNVITKKGPFERDNNSTFKIMRNLLLALIPIILFSFYKNGYVPYKDGKTDITGLFYPLIFILLPALTSFLTELLWARFILKKKGTILLTYVKSSFSIFPGLFLGLILPINTPIEILIFGSIFATTIGKLVYGGFGHNIFNPALVGRIFVISTYALAITNKGGYLNPSELDAVTTATPLSNIVSGIGTYDTLVKPYGSLLDFFIGNIPGAMGETSALLCLLGLIYLSLTKVIKWIVPVTYLSTAFIITFFIGTINGVGIWYPLFQLLSGGLMFGAVFMATDPVTSPVTKQGQLIYGISLGLLTVIFRYLTPYPEGVLTSILTMNMLVFIIDKLGLKAKNKKLYLIIPLLILLSLITSITLYIGNSFEKPQKDFEIKSKEKNGSITTYIATTKGYSSTIEAKIVFDGNKLTTYEILKQNDSFYQNVENKNYLQKLISNQNALDNLDTVAGATVTSTAIKKLLINIVDDYTKGKGLNNEVKEEPKADFQILDETIDGENTIYTITKTSFGGDLKLSVIVNNGEVTSIEVLETNDSYFDKLYENNFLSQIVENQTDLENLDTVAGATISSKSVKEAIIKLKEKINETNEPISEPKSDFEVLEETTEGENTIYTISKTSFGGDLKLKVTTNNNNITNIEVLETKDSYFNKLYQNDYLNQIVTNQDNLENLDTVAGATISSTSVKEAIIKLNEIMGEIQ